MLLGILNPVSLLVLDLKEIFADQAVRFQVVDATAFIFLLNNITVQGLAFFAPTIVATIYPEASVVSLQLHTVPPYVVGAFFTVLFPFLSTIFDRRIYIMFCSAPFMMIGYIIFLVSAQIKRVEDSSLTTIDL